MLSYRHAFHAGNHARQRVALDIGKNFTTQPISDKEKAAQIKAIQDKEKLTKEQATARWEQLINQRATGKQAGFQSTNASFR